MSYRRDDTGYAAELLYQVLTKRFGSQDVFKDINSIDPGDDAAEAISKAVASCDVLLALIGPESLTITGQDGRRLDDPADYIRLEIEAALTRKVCVIPVLFDGASMPRGGELPPSLAKLADRQAVKLRLDRFQADTEPLLLKLDQTITQARQQARQEAERSASAELPAGGARASTRRTLRRPRAASAGAAGSGG